MPFNSIFAWMMKKRIHQIDLFRKYPIHVQEELFMELLQTAAHTEWGEKHLFASIQNYADFKSTVPLQSYEDLKPFVDRMIQGEKNLLWPGEIKWFAKSSGTTSNRSKFIPVSKDSLEGCHYKGGKDLLALYYENFPNRKLYKGKHLILGGSSELNSFGENSYLGDLSAIIVKNLPWWAEIRRTPAKEITLMSDWEHKIEKMAAQTVNEDVYILAGVPSWMLVLCRKVLEISGKKDLKEVWPNLELFMHGGVSFEPYRNEFKRIISSPDMNYVETYNASEGFFGIQDQKDSNELLLMLDYGIFYELIPMDSFAGTESKVVIRLEDAEIGINYALVISSNAGLWRYILGDTIQFTNTLPYRFKITGRTKSFINAFGEELIVDNAEVAMAKACEKHHAQVKEYTAAPVFMGEDNANGAHEWIVEFEREPSDLAQFSADLDVFLREINSDYDAKRSFDFVLRAPIVRIAPSGTFDTWLRQNDKLGGQHKIPRLMNDRSILEQILRIFPTDS